MTLWHGNTWKRFWGSILDITWSGNRIVEVQGGAGGFHGLIVQNWRKVRKHRFLGFKSLTGGYLKKAMKFIFNSGWEVYQNGGEVVIDGCNIAFVVRAVFGRA